MTFARWNWTIFPCMIPTSFPIWMRIFQSRAIAQNVSLIIGVLQTWSFCFPGSYYSPHPEARRSNRTAEKQFVKDVQLRYSHGLQLRRWALSQQSVISYKYINETIFGELSIALCRFKAFISFTKLGVAIYNLA